MAPDRAIRASLGMKVCVYLERNTMEDDSRERKKQNTSKIAIIRCSEVKTYPALTEEGKLPSKGSALSSLLNRALKPGLETAHIA